MLLLRKDVVHKTRAGWHLFWCPETLSWVITDAVGAQILEALRNISFWEDLVRLLVSKGILQNGDQCELHNFLTEIKGAGLLQNDDDETFKHRENRQPFYLYLHLTERCNLSCSYCYFFAVPRSKTASQDFPLSLAPHLFRQAKDLGISNIIVTGGEPLLHRHALDIIECAKQFGFFVELLTNGTMITHQIAKVLAKFCDRITVSIDSANPDVHDKHRGQGSHARAVRAVQLLKEAGVPEIAVAGVITRDNQDEPFSLFQAFAQRLGADKVSRQVYILQGTPNDRNLLPDFPRLIARLDQELDAWIKAGDYQGQEESLWRRENCGAGSGVIAIGADANVYPCQGLTKTQFAVGNLHEQSLSEIYHNSEKLERLRAFYVDAIAKCKTCAYRYLCGGGCRALALNSGGSLSSPIPPEYCSLNQLIHEWKIWRVALAKVATKVS